MQVAMSDLKAALSRYVAKARAGEIIEITSHDKAVARIVAVLPVPASGIARLLANGGAQWSGSKATPAPALALGKVGKTVSQMVLEDRR